MDRNTATTKIDQQLREDGIHYGFSDLRSRFAAGLEEADEYGDDRVWIKIPSGSEFSVRTTTVRAALGR